jgi:hypothetical protein
MRPSLRALKKRALLGAVGGVIFAGVFASGACSSSKSTPTCATVCALPDAPGCDSMCVSSSCSCSCAVECDGLQTVCQEAGHGTQFQDYLDCLVSAGTYAAATTTCMTMNAALKDCAGGGEFFDAGSFDVNPDAPITLADGSSPSGTCESQGTACTAGAPTCTSTAADGCTTTCQCVDSMWVCGADNCLDGGPVDDSDGGACPADTPAVGAACTSSNAACNTLEASGCIQSCDCESNVWTCQTLGNDCG